MVTAIKENTQEETAAEEGRFEVEENVQELVEAEAATEAQLGHAAFTAELLVHPFNTPVQALTLCNILKKELGAEVLYMEGSPVGTVIKVIIRKPVQLADFLCRSVEVADAWEESAPQKSRVSDTLLGLMTPGLVQPYNPSREPDKIVCVAMKPPNPSQDESMDECLDRLVQQDAQRAAPSRVVAAAAVAD